ncbi:ras-related protein Rab-18A-like [Anopheles marshallii]|uniref:ras-related protein Rab-18A-like n=1 Tax=Anopheles marshallii TaxID=1521116 RepID=UPI00237A6D92|nr:ras-related protein Rab-18A-like [Anopheles marshallii]
MVVGESEVGKTSLMMRYIGANFRNYRKTIDFEYEKKPLYMKGEQINLGILDTACIEKFRSVSQMYYTGVRGAILVYDVTDRETLNMLESWIRQLEMHGTHKNMVKIIVANKIDQPFREVSKDDGMQFANERGMMYMETSAKTNIGVKDAFEALVRKIMETNGLWPPESVNINYNYNYNLVDQQRATIPVTNQPVTNQPSMFTSIIEAISSIFESNQRNVNYN